MAWFETGSGGGKTLEETVLWTNSSPTSEQSAGTATLSDNLNNYDFVKIYWRLSVGNSITASMIIPMEDFIYFGSTGPCPRAGLVTLTSNDNKYVRQVVYGGSGNSVSWGSSGLTGGSTVSNTMNIITKISGLKQLDEVKEWSPSIAILGTSSSVARGTSLSMTLTLPSTGIYRIYPVVAYASGNSPYSASTRNPNSCTFTGATVLSQNDNTYTIDATSTSVKITMATGLTASTSFNMLARVFQLLEN